MLLFDQAPFWGRLGFADFLNSRNLTGEAVEVGTHRGEFATAFLAAWQGKKLWCVDPYLSGYDRDDPASQGDREADYQAAWEALKPHEGRYQFLHEKSVLAATRFEDEQLDFVYIDGNHRYASVCLDLDGWWPKLKPGGVLAGHDFLEQGAPVCWGEEVQPAVVEFAMQHGLTIYLVPEVPEGAWSYYAVKS